METELEWFTVYQHTNKTKFCSHSVSICVTALLPFNGIPLSLELYERLTKLSISILKMLACYVCLWTTHKEQSFSFIIQFSEGILKYGKEEQ